MPPILSSLGHSDENISNINSFNNENEVPVYDESIIKASWGINDHKDAIDNNNLSVEAARIIKLGVVFPDNYKFGLDQQNRTIPWFQKLCSKLCISCYNCKKMLYKWYV